MLLRAKYRQNDKIKKLLLYMNRSLAHNGLKIIACLLMKKKCKLMAKSPHRTKCKVTWERKTWEVLNQSERKARSKTRNTRKSEILLEASGMEIHKRINRALSRIEI